MDPSPRSPRIELCGGLSIEIDGRRVEAGLPGRQGRLLFAYLVLNRDRPVARTELIEALWWGKPPGAPGSALSALLSRLRRLLGAARIEGRSEIRLVLPDDVRVDVEEAERAAASVKAALAAGEPLRASAPANLVLEVTERGLMPALDAPWLEDRRRELDELALGALECIAEIGLAVGGSELAAGERAARRLVDRAPYRETGHRYLMEALHARGDVAEALQAYERLRVLLREELGTVPAPEIQELHARLLRGPAPRLGTDSPELPSPLARAARGPFVGRAHALRRLAGAWERTGAGEPPLVLVAGEAGIGKTRLCAELAGALAADGALVLFGRCEEETLVPYQPFVEALARRVAECDVHALRRMAGNDGGELARMLPGLRNRVPGLAAPVPGPPESERYRLFESVRGFLGAAGAGPTLLVLDDLHWADVPTLHLLKHILHEPPASPLLVVATYRPEGAGGALPQALAGLERTGPVERIALGGLDRDEVATLLSARGASGSDSLVAGLLDRTEGNPFFIEAILRQLARTGVLGTESAYDELDRMGVPEGARQVIAGWLGRLGTESRGALAAAAAIGREFELDVLERVLALPADALLDLLEDAVAAGLVAEVPDALDRYAFVHALIREAAYEDLGGARRARLHARIGSALEELRAAERERHLGALAHHFLAAAGAGDLRRAVEYSRQAAERASAQLAYEDAAVHRERALRALELGAQVDDAERCELLLELGDSLYPAGDGERAREVFLEAASIARVTRDPARLARAAVGLGGPGIRMTPGVVDATLVDLLEEALAALRDSEPALRARVMARLAMELYWIAPTQRRTALSREAVEIARGLPERSTLAYTLSCRHVAIFGPESSRERLAVAGEMIRVGEEMENEEAQLLGHLWRLTDLLELGDVVEADRELEEYARLAPGLRRPDYLWRTPMLRGMRALMSGRFEESEREIVAARRIAERAGDAVAPHLLGAHTFILRREQGRLPEMEETVGSFVTRFPGLPAWRCFLAALRAETGRPDEARAEIARLAPERFAAVPRDGNWLVALSLLSEACAATGYAKAAEALYAVLVPHARRHVVVGAGAAYFGLVAHHAGMAAATAGRHEEALAHFREALAEHERATARPWLARTQVEYGAALLAAGAVAQAEGPLRQGFETARELGMPRTAKRAEMLQWWRTTVG
ncbi:MAG TPA: AAA family ATPase [Thermoleophilaceae bacterium]